MSEIPYGYCHCGCGEKTAITPRNHAPRGLIKGQPKRFLPWHHLRPTGPEYLEQDAGYSTPCWIWQRSHDRDGYGLASVEVDGRYTSRGAHRLYYENEIGPIPEGLEIDHLCENKGCVNPSHLEPVTHAENMRRSCVTKLSPADVGAIRASDEPGKVLAERFGVGTLAISRIRCRRSWADAA